MHVSDTFARARIHARLPALSCTHALALLLGWSGFSPNHQKKKQLYGNAEDGCRGTGEVAVDDDWVQGLYDMEGMSADTA
jgi:hypothetical protein